MSEPENVIAANEEQFAASSSTAVSNPGAHLWIAAIMIGGFLIGIGEAALGWALIVKVLLWIVTVGLWLFAIFLVYLANEANSTEKDRAEAWIGVAIFATIGFATWIAIPPGEQTPLSAMPARTDDSLTPQGRRTFEYWNRLYGILVRSRATSPKSPQELAPHCNALATEIDRMAAVSVDTDALDCAMALRSWLVELAAENQRRGSSEALVGAIVRGYQGDIFGPFLDETANTESFAQRFRAIQNQFVSTRAVLSSRYGTEFARIEF